MSQGKKLKVVLVESSTLIVLALQNLISHDPRFQLVESLTSGGTFIAGLSEGRLNCDVILVGWQLIDMDAGEVLIALRRTNAAARIVVFCNENNVNILKRCVRLGAQGFCYQFGDPDVLLDTLLAVANDRICIPRIDLSCVDESPLSQLTVREHELLAALSDGWSNFQIAARTGISENTVKYHLKNLYDKLGVRNRAMAVSVFSSERKYSLRSPAGSGR